MAEVRLVGVTKRFGNVVAVDRVDLEVRDKEFLVLVGPSGCGKTTCLRLIAGLEEVTEGEIYIDGKLVNDVPPKDRDIAMVFQNYALYPHMTVYENMAFGLRLRRVPVKRIGPWVLTRRQFSAEEIDRRVQGAAKMLGLQEMLHRKPRELSGGQRQRVALGRAIVREPKVFLMDEPLSNLDAKLRVQTRAELIRLHRTLGITTIYVTHDQVEAMTMGERIAVMNNGAIQQVDTPLNLYHHPANLFVAGFIGSPQMNFVPVRLERRGEGLWVNAGAFQVRLPERWREEAEPYTGRELILGLRPEDIASLRFASFPTNAFNTLRAVVDVVEPMGATDILYLSIGPHTLVASVDSGTSAQEGETGEFALNLEKAHLFDPQTEKALF